jgi:NADPH:quinone reductase-like Zn-dependent oxidoreductase
MSQHNKNFAAVLHKVATPLVVEEVPIPTPGPTEVLIRNHAIAVNPIDWKRQAWGFAIQSYPVVMGGGKFSRFHLSIARKSFF